MAAMKKQAIEIPALGIQNIIVPIVGDSPLVCHAWSEKAKQMMLAKQMKKASKAKEAKDPLRDFVESMYWLSGRPKTFTPAAVEKAVQKGRFGFRAVAIKAAAVSACRNIDGMTMTMARGAFHIGGELLEILGDKPVMREDMVRLGGNTADIRYRGEFTNWRIEVPVRYNPGVISPEQLLNLFNIGGFACGIGEHRPQRDGSWGMFHVGTE